MKGFFFGLLLCTAGCPPLSTDLGVILQPKEPKMQRSRFEQLSFEHPDDWSVERVPSTDANISVVGGLSADNKSLFMLVSLKSADPNILRETDLVQSAKEKFFNNAEPVNIAAGVSINNLTGTRAEFVSTLGNSVVGAFSNSAHRALLFTGYQQNTAFIFVVATEERSVEAKTEQLLRTMINSIKSETF
jgi:hypothetical protein